MGTIWQDIRFGLRVLRKNPGFTAAAIVTLSLGIGANTAIFSVVYGVLLRPLPYRSGEQLVVLRQQAPLAKVENLPFSVKEVNDYREQNQTLSSVVEYHTMPFILLGRREPERVQTGVVSAEFFDFLGVRPLVGRTFRPGEDRQGAEPVLVLSYGYWQRSHGGEANVVGRTFQMNDRVHTVVGVLPPIPQFPDENDVYMPVSACPFRSAQATVENRNARMVRVFGRLKPGVAPEQAGGDLAAIAGRLQQAYPANYPKDRGYGVTLAPLQEELTRRARPTLLVLLGAAGLVLLIACANVANLMLARLIRRERELSVRAALGAGRARLVRQLLTESTLLSLLGGGLGLLLAGLGLELLKAFAARFTPRAAEVGIDGPTLLFTFAVAVLTGVAFGALPALAAKENLVTSLKEGGQSTASPGRQRARGLMVVCQVAVSFVLLIGAGLMLRSFVKLQQVEGGFDAERVLTMRVTLDFDKYTTAQQVRAFFHSLLDRVRAQPGVVSAAVAFTFPLNQSAPLNNGFLIEGRPLAEGDPRPVADFRSASPDYFQAVGIPLVRGRLFDAHDHENAQPVVLINQSMARHRWNNEDPVGRRVSFDNGQTWATVVGVVGDVKQYGLEREATDELYRPFAQAPFGQTLVVRTAAEPLALARQVREAVTAVDPEQAVDRVQTLEQVRENSLAAPRLTAALIGLFAALALAITLAGVSGVIALTVSQRTREIGVRLALGATPGGVLAMILRQGMRLVLIGLALGAAGALAFARLMGSLLFGVGPTDALTYAGVSLAFVAVAAVACLIPARRATRIDPMIALRSE
jgi:putative ABC transport system permease protein